MCVPATQTGDRRAPIKAHRADDDHQRTDYAVRARPGRSNLCSDAGGPAAASDTRRVSSYARAAEVKSAATAAASFLLYASSSFRPSSPNSASALTFPRRSRCWAIRGPTTSFCYAKAGAVKPMVNPARTATKRIFIVSFRVLRWVVAQIRMLFVARTGRWRQCHSRCRGHVPIIALTSINR